MAEISKVGENGAGRLRRRWALALAAPVLAAIVVFLSGFAAFLTSLEQTERAPAAATDGIVALTGAAQRIEDAIDLLAKGYGGRLLITGVNERTSRDTIKSLSPGQRGWVECCVDLDYRARNTVGNAAEISRWTRAHGFQSLIVVTSNYHLPRTLAELDETLPDIRKVPYAVVASARPDGWRGELSRLRLLLAEYMKFVAVSVRTRVAANRDPTPHPPSRFDMTSVADPGSSR